MTWAKLHTDILGDPKLMRAVRRGEKSLYLLPWLIAFAKEADNDGQLTVGTHPAEPADIAPRIPNATEEKVAECLESLERIGVLTRSNGEILRFVAWDKRTHKPSASKEAVRDRVKKSRAKRKKSDAPDDPANNAEQPDTEDTSHPVTPPKGVTVTPPEGVTVTPCNATEQSRTEQNRRDQSRPRAARAAADASVLPITAGRKPMTYLTRCVVAMNLGMQRNAAAGATFAEIAASTQSGAVMWEADGIDIATVERVIETVCANFRPSAKGKQVNSLRYFDAAVRERWAQLQATGDVARAAGSGRTPERTAWLRKNGYET